MQRQKRAGYGLVAREGDVELRVAGQAEGSSDGIRELVIPLQARCDAETVGAAAKAVVMMGWSNSKQCKASGSASARAFARVCTDRWS